jgi:hypothetical protein
MKLPNNCYFEEYKERLTINLDKAFHQLSEKTDKADDFRFYLANSAVHSSNIEGNTVSFDTYLKATEFNLHLKTKEIKEIDDLIKAYQFAQENELSFSNLLKAHELITTSVLVKKERGKIRKMVSGKKIRISSMVYYLGEKLLG